MNATLSQFSHAFIPLLAEQDTPFHVHLLLLLGMLFITLSIFFSVRKRQKRKATQPTASENLERLDQQRAVSGDLENLMVEIEQLAKRMGHQLDAKAHHLQRLIDQADERIEQIKQLENGPSTSSHVTSHIAADEQAEPKPERPVPTDASDTATTISQAFSEPSADTQVSTGLAGDDELTRAVYDLADQGHATVEIARRLDEHIGKIELMLALRNA